LAYFVPERRQNVIHHPIVLGTKAVILLILIIVLIILHGVLPPEQFRIAVYACVGVFLLSVVAIWTAVFVMLANPNSRLSRSMVLHPPAQDKTGDREERRLASLVGAEGVAETNLRPSGIGVFGDEYVDVLSGRGFIGKGATIVVESVTGKVVKVKELQRS
jgi:membrane-bound serine protease (ClpP class)